MRVLVTGGTGYIGSHTAVELIKRGNEVIIADNLSNSQENVIDKIKEITGVKPKFYLTELTNREETEKLFKENKFDAVIHFAGLKAVGESCLKPLMYYNNNLTSSIILAETMAKYGCKKLIFSSSATVYGEPERVPIKEDFPLSTTNPYGTTKLMIERIYTDLVKADPEWNVTLLRYFNPIGAHDSGLIGEKPNGIPNNLMPYIVKVAAGELYQLSVFGNDYPTHDGTGVRDYIHVTDLALGHVAALEKVAESGVHVYNLGTGTGYSVLDIVKAFEKVNGVKVPYVITNRRPGDIPECVADPTKAYEELGWKTVYGLEEMCRSSWHFLEKMREN
ncbi:MAG: UDP-glucose 4-epimerase GalE [Ruminococcaceae bacterium]|nr:UDP-glucose 4-epimerase GalE [Oscillospiraceae bacterium]